MRCSALTWPERAESICSGVARRNGAALAWIGNRRRLLGPAAALALAVALGASLGPAAAQVPDTTPPETTIIGGPTGRTTDQAPTFTFSANESGATFECRTDSRPYAACSELGFGEPLGRGPHTFEVRATDSSGNADPTPAKVSFTILLPPPVLGRAVNARPVRGRVAVSPPPGRKGLRFTAVKNPRQIAVGSFVDTRRGTVRLISARNRRGHTQSGTFTGGLFQVLQSRRSAAKGLTQLVLKGASFRGCASTGAAQARAALSKRVLRRLHSSASGRYRTRGRYGAATVRGTKWSIADRCDGTLTRVSRGQVTVRDFRRRRTILVRAGRSYLARATSPAGTD